MRRQPVLPFSRLLSLSTVPVVLLGFSCLAARADKGVTSYFPAPLQGGVKEESQINPSLRLTPQYQGRASAAPRYGPSLNPMQGQYVPETIRGSVHSGGSEGGISDGPVMFSGDRVKGSNGGMYGVIPPISSYNRTPATGVMNYIPGSDVSYMHEGRSQSQSGLPQHYRTVGRGVTVLSPELTVSSIPRSAPAVPMFGGSMVGSALTTMQNMQTSVQMISPAMNTGAVVKNLLPASEETHYVTRNGITTAPGFEVTLTPPGLTKETLGGQWSSNPPPASRPIELSAVPGTMQTQHIFTRVEPAAEIARAGVLSQFQPGKCDNWPQWYRAVAKTIYTHWQNVDVCPGTVRMEVTVKADHEISGKVTDFIPAPDIERNVAKETQFRETAVRVVDGIGFFELPNFPNVPAEQAVFDIELKRTVNGPAGIQVVGVPSK